MVDSLFGVIEALTVPELSRRAELETTIERGLQTFVDVGLALMEIRDARLYRADYGTFEEYCRERWGWTRQHTNRMIASAEVTTNLEPLGSILPATERQARPLAALPPDLQRDVWREALDTAPNGKITAAHVQGVADRMTQPRHCPYCGHSYSAVVPSHEVTQCPSCRELHSYSGARDTEKYGPYRQPELEPEKKYPTVAANHAETEGDDWCTPLEYVEAVRAVLGAIDLDPATNEFGQSIIGASVFHTKQDDGLSQPWRGRVFLNPPYSVPLIDRFAAKILDEIASGNVTEAIVLTNNSTETQWFQSLLGACSVVCFPARRLKFWKSGNDVFATRQGQAFFYFGPGEKFAEVFSGYGTILVRV